MPKCEVIAIANQKGGVGKKYFEELIDEMKEKKGVTQDVELTAKI